MFERKASPCLPCGQAARHSPTLHPTMYRGSHQRGYVLPAALPSANSLDAWGGLSVHFGIAVDRNFEEIIYRKILRFRLSDQYCSKISRGTRIFFRSASCFT